MNKAFWFSLALLIVIAALAYLPLVGQFGYTFDDWYLMWSAKTYGAHSFHAIYSVDRPLRGYVMEAAYALLGENPLWYDLSAWVWRVLSGLAFFWTLRKVWSQHLRETLGAALLFVLYPGFLSQYNGIDYQSQMVSLAAAMFSIALAVQACLVTSFWRKAVLMFFSIALGWVYLGLVEYEIGFEFLRLGLMAVLFFRETGSFWKKLLRTLGGWLPYSLVTLGFGYWRIFVFVSERNATDTELQFEQFFASPFATLWHWIVQTAQDTVDVLFSAWIVPLRQVVNFVSWWGLGLALLGMGLAWTGILRTTRSKPDGRTHLEMLVLGLLSAVVSLIPVVMVNREVAFPYFSRYALTSSAGVALFFAGGLIFLRENWRALGFASLVGLALLLHQANSAHFAFETAVLRRFWWQVAWRVPQLEQNTTLTATWPVAAQQEDYFAWGPASLIYFPEKMNDKYMQPGVFAVLPGVETVEKVLARERQQYDKRRNIITYANYRNLLVLIQNRPSECVRVMDGSLPELSLSDNDLFKQMAPYSEIEHVLVNAPQRLPPAIPFGPEPEHTWCFYYEKASLARQKGNWGEVRRLGDEARTNEVFYTANPIEWIPFLQAYAVNGDVNRLTELAPMINADPYVSRQACQILHGMTGFSEAVLEKMDSLYCSG